MIDAMEVKSRVQDASSLKGSDRYDLQICHRRYRAAVMHADLCPLLRSLISKSLLYLCSHGLPMYACMCVSLHVCVNLIQYSLRLDLMYEVYEIGKNRV